MSTVHFNRDELAHWYAIEHLKTDPGIVAVFYLPTQAGEREIRFVEINNLIGERSDEGLEPIDFGIEIGTENAHNLWVLDVTSDQWHRILSGQLSLPANWSLEGMIEVGPHP